MTYYKIYLTNGTVVDYNKDCHWFDTCGAGSELIIFRCTSMGYVLGAIPRENILKIDAVREDSKNVKTSRQRNKKTGNLDTPCRTKTKCVGYGTEQSSGETGPKKEDS